MNVLLVDDHPMLIGIYESLLFEHYNYYHAIKISKAHNCEQAFSKINHSNNRIEYNLAIIDYNLPAYPSQNINNETMSRYCSGNIINPAK
jgi:DNA-binding NarL/FixJ family response regulator